MPKNFSAKLRNGFMSRLRAEILPRFKKRITADCAFVNLSGKKTSHGGELRHGTFMGLRDDKAATKVVREA